MTRQDWRELWHRAQDGEQLSETEQRRLTEALQDPQHRRDAARWASATEQLRRAALPPFSSPDAATSAGGLARAAVQDIQLQRVLSRPPPAALRPVAAEVASDIALSAWLSAEVALPRPLAATLAARIAQDVPESAPLETLLRQWPSPALPHSLAASLSARVAAEAQGASSPPEHSGPPTQATPPEELPAALPPLGRTRLNPPGGPSGLGGLGVVLAFGGLTVLRSAPATQHTLDTLGAVRPLALPLVDMLGLGVLALLSWLIVARPTPAVRRLGALAFAMTAVLTLPALWDTVQQTPLRPHLAALGSGRPAPHLLLERWLGAGLLLVVTALLLRGGWGARLARRQRRAPIQTLAAGTLAGLALGGLALMLLSFGWTGASTALGALSAFAAAIGLSVSLHAAGRSVARRLHLALPEVSGPLAGLLAFSASLSVPALAASLAIIGSAWGLGTLLLGREAARM